MRKIFLALMILIMTFTPADSTTIDSQIKSQRKTQNDLRKKIKQYNAIAQKKAKQSKTLLGQLSKLKRDANASQVKMKELEKENGKLKNSMDGLNKNISSVNNSINEILTTYRARLVEIYKYDQGNNLNVLFASENPHEIINTAYMMKIFAKQDEEFLSELNRKEFELNNARNMLAENQKQVQKQTEALKKQRAEFNSTIKKTDTLLKNVQAEEKKALAAAKELETAQKAVGNKINALMRQKKQASNSNAASKNQSSKNSKSSATMRLSWPLKGRITAHYGTRVHPTFKTKVFNSGIDIKASAGAQVKAAGAGEVLFKGWLKGFGQVVIIDHGNNISTVYAHLASSNVKEGSRVKAGAVIGRVGNSGTSSDYGLHFEVRNNGNAQNPLNFLRN